MTLKLRILEKNMELVEAIKCQDHPSEIQKIRVELNKMMDDYLNIPIMDSTGVYYYKNK